MVHKKLSTSTLSSIPGVHPNFSLVQVPDAAAATSQTSEDAPRYRRQYAQRGHGLKFHERHHRPLQDRHRQLTHDVHCVSLRDLLGAASHRFHKPPGYLEALMTKSQRLASQGMTRALLAMTCEAEGCDIDGGFGEGKQASDGDARWHRRHGLVGKPLRRGGDLSKDYGEAPQEGRSVGIDWDIREALDDRSGRVRASKDVQ